MDPRRLYSQPQSVKEIEIPDEVCSYSTVSSVSCTNDECVKQTHQYRQCGNRPKEELIKDDDGTEHWEPTEDAAPHTIDVMPLTGLDTMFRMIRDQSPFVIGHSLIDALPLSPTPPTHSLSSPHAIQITDRANQEVEESRVQTSADIIADELHDLVDLVFGRRPRRRSSEDQSQHSSRG